MVTWLRKTILAAALMAGIAPVMAQVPPPVPALPDAERRTTYTISGSNCACSVGFALYGDNTDYQNWVQVYIDGVAVAYNDASRGWTITSPSGQLSALPRPITNAVLTFNNPQTGTVQIVGARRPRRVSQFTENRGVAARDLNQAITDLEAQVRELWDRQVRTVQGAPGETLALLPLIADRANLNACYDASGNLTACASLGSTTITAGLGISFTGSGPLSISANLVAGTNISLSGTGTNPITISANIPAAPSISMAIYSAGGTSNDTTGVQAAFTACAVSGCILTCPTQALYTVDTITVGSKTSVRGCNFKQRTAGTSILSLSSVDTVRIQDSKFTGNSVTTGLSAPNFADFPIGIQSSSRVWIQNNYFTAFASYDIKSKQSSYIYIQNNYAYGVAFGSRLLCTTHAMITDNTWEHTSLYASSPTSNQFAIGPTLDSDVCGHNDYVTISGNTVLDFPYSQAYLVHSGSFVTISGNKAYNVSVCVSVNTFNNNDAIQNVSITGNACQASTGFTLPTDTNGGITVTGGSGIPSPIAVSITGNSLIGFGREFPDANVGCININLTIAATITGNVLQACGSNGIVVQGADRSFAIVGNNIDTIITGASNSNGVKIVSGSAAGIVSANNMYTMSINVNNAGSGGNIKFTSLNQCLSVTTCN